MKTEETIKRLREAADKLEEIKEDFPNLSWSPAHHSPAKIWNGNMETLEGEDSILWKLARDPAGIKKATNLGYRHHTGGDMWAVVKYKELPNIPVMTIYGIQSCHDECRKEKICNIVKDLPLPLRYKVYRTMAAHRRKVKREKHERMVQLKRELRELGE